MAGKSLGDRRAEKLAQMETLKKELALLEAKAGERIGKLAVKAGVADLDLDDDTLLKELQGIAGRFRREQKKPDQAARASAGSA